MIHALPASWSDPLARRAVRCAAAELHRYESVESHRALRQDHPLRAERESCQGAFRAAFRSKFFFPERDSATHLGLPPGSELKPSQKSAVGRAVPVSPESVVVLEGVAEAGESHRGAFEHYAGTVSVSGARHERTGSCPMDSALEEADQPQRLPQAATLDRRASEP